MEKLKEKLENIDIDIKELDALYEAYKEDAQVVNLIAMNISLRTTVKNRKHEKCEALSNILKKLSTSSDMATRWSVAKNPCTPIEVLESLAKDKVNLVRALVATNPSTPKNLLIQFFEDEKIVRDGLSGNPSTPKDLLEKLAHDSDKNVQKKAKETLKNIQENL